MVFTLQMRCTHFVQSLLGDGTILHSFQHSGIGIGKTVGHQQQVCTGLQRLDRRLTGGIHTVMACIASESVTIKP